MSKSEVIFSVNDKRYPYQYDRSLLQLGTIVYVEFDSRGNPVNFSPTKSETNFSFVVNWIAPSEWYVQLQDRFEITAQKLLYIVATVKDYIDSSSVKKALAIAASDVRLKYLYKTSEFEKSRLCTIWTVADRISLYARLKIHDVSNKLAGHYESLSGYLLLTCFDRLGQPSDWMNFGSWLSHVKKEKEREIQTRTIKEAPINPIKAADALYKQYNKIYGVKRSFFNFFNNVLPEGMRSELLNSIVIQKMSNPPSLNDLGTGTEKEIKEYLFRLRNRYTHSAQFVEGFQETAGPDENDFNWRIFEQWVESDHWVNVYVKINWLEVIEKAVRVGLAEYMNRILN